MIETLCIACYIVVCMKFSSSSLRCPYYTLSVGIDKMHMTDLVALSFDSEVMLYT